MKKNKVSKEYVVAYFSDFLSKIVDLSEYERVWIAVSGGRDSMYLLYLSSLLKEKGVIKRLSAIHIDHGTSDKSLEIYSMVKKYCKELGVELHKEKFSLSLNESNFENKARQVRLKSFSKIVGPKEVLFQGHHIDDSIEWSLMQKFKSSSLSSTLGIPVKRKNIIRPLMCMSRAQITSEVKRRKVPFYNDPSNFDTKFERNRMRSLLKRNIAPYYQSYIKNYVFQHNELARKLGKSAFKKSLDDITIKREGRGISLNKKSGDFSGLESLIEKTIRSLSLAKRGKLSLQIQKLINAQKKNKSGPLLFSGGVLAYLQKQFIFFIHRDDVEEHFKKLDQKALSNLKLGKSFKTQSFPYLEFCLNKRKSKQGIKLKDSLLPVSTNYAIKNSIYAKRL